jgi:hypothetical protein
VPSVTLAFSFGTPFLELESYGKVRRCTGTVSPHGGLLGVE